MSAGVASRSRSKNVNFYEKLFEVDSSGFEAALKLAKKNGTMGAWEENDLRCAFYVRLALSLLHGNSEDYCKKSLEISKSISMQSTIKYIDMLYCEDEEKARMKEML